MSASKTKEKLTLFLVSKILARLYFVLLMLVITFLVLVILPQSYEVFLDISGKGIGDRLEWTSGIGVLALASMIWFSTRILLRVLLFYDHDIGKLAQATSMPSAAETFFKYLPRAAGFLVIVFYAIKLFSFPVQWPWIVVLLLISAIYWFFVVNRRILFSSFVSIPDYLTPLEWKYSAWPLAFRRTLGIYLAIYLLALLLFSIYSIAIGLSQWLGPLFVLTFGLATITFFACLLQAMDIRSKLPVSLLFLLLLFVIDLSQNNDLVYEVRPTSRNTITEERLGPYFSNWYQADARPWNQDTIKKPLVILVAGQGGGSRAAYWISGMLSVYDSVFADFYPSVFAISSVSGSSAGTGYYIAARKTGNATSSKLTAVAGADYLSPNTVPIFFSELLQQVIPALTLRWTDRSKYLEEAWSREFTKVFDSALLDRHYLDLYDDRYSTPLQFYNNTVVERGQQAVTAPFIPQSRPSHNQIITISSDVALKTAMSMSARFPFFTSAATVRVSDCDYKLNVVDGGYFENSGLGTTLEVYKSLKHAQANDTSLREAKFLIIYLQNGKGDYHQENNQVNTLKVLTAPLNSLIKSWGTETSQMMDEMDYVTGLNQDDFLIQKLKYEERGFPLSRYLSDSTKREISRQFTHEALIPYFERDEE